MTTGLSHNLQFLFAIFVLLGLYLWWSQSVARKRLVEQNKLYDDYLESAKAVNNQLIERTEKQGNDLLKEVQAIRSLLEKQS